MVRGRDSLERSRHQSETHAAKQRMYEQFARIPKALASPVRLELLDVLVQGERSVEELATTNGLSVANASQHLQVLAAARLVNSRREGHRVLYRIADGSVEALLQTLRSTAERRIAELESVARSYLARSDEFEQIDRAELIRRMEAGTVVLIDVRPPEEFVQGHLPGAISVPLDEVERWALATPKDKEVVAYCRGPYCVWAIQAVERLTAHGIRAARLRDGVGEWRVAGLPIESSPAY
jgi:rhodanese-related sulfurtransferase/DNA-binding transcriptional ArsR family regulator